MPIATRGPGALPGTQTPAKYSIRQRSIAWELNRRVPRRTEWQVVQVGLHPTILLRTPDLEVARAWRSEEGELAVLAADADLTEIAARIARKHMVHVDDLWKRPGQIRTSMEKADRARFEFCYAARGAGFSVSAIGLFLDRHTSSVSYACQRWASILTGVDRPKRTSSAVSKFAPVLERLTGA